MNNLTQKQKDRQKKAAKSIVSNISLAIVELASIRAEIESGIAMYSEGRYCGALQRANSDLREVMSETLTEARNAIIAELHNIGALPLNR